MSNRKTRKKRAEEFKETLPPAEPCLNCGKYERHFAPPSLGEEGFFICTPARWKAEENEQAEARVHRLTKEQVEFNEQIKNDLCLFLRKYYPESMFQEYQIKTMLALIKAQLNPDNNVSITIYSRREGKNLSNKIINEFYYQTLKSMKG